MFVFATYNSAVKNKSVLILSTRYYLGFSLMMLMIFDIRTDLFLTADLFNRAWIKTRLYATQNNRHLILLSLVSAVLF